MSKNKGCTTLKGFRDFLPSEMRVRNYVKKVFIKTFEQFGFEPLETPTLEYSNTLLNKYGADADKLVYTFKDKGKREVGLNYDLTVPTARVLAQYASQLPLPFKRYQIQKAYRAEKPQKGRYREFVMCDIDIIGSKSPESDAEILFVDYALLTKLGFKNFKIKVNDRQVLFDLLSNIGLKNLNKQLSIIRSIDKLDKKSTEEVKMELKAKRVDSNLIAQLFDGLKKVKPTENLKKIIELAVEAGVPQNYIVFEPFLSRGLDYYTGMIVEVTVKKPKIGSICGGGRYDNLIEKLGGPSIPATGNTIGFERVCNVIQELGLLKDKIPPSTSKVLITRFLNTKEAGVNLKKLANFLRSAKINTELYLNASDSISKQIKYANKKGIPFVTIIGSDEEKNNLITIKDLRSSKQKTLNLKEAVKLVKMG